MFKNLIYAPLGTSLKITPERNSVCKAFFCFEREKHQCESKSLIGCFLRASYQGSSSYLGVCPDQELNRQLFGAQDDTESTEPHLCDFYNIHVKECLSRKNFLHFKIFYFQEAVL